jgi:hypothetical protein
MPNAQRSTYECRVARRAHASLSVARWALAVALYASLAIGCGPRRISIPTDPGTPLPDFARIHADVSAACRGVRTLTAVLSLSGRAAGQSLGGTVSAGFERPGSMLLELRRGPFGSLGFVFAASGSGATLYLPRENGVVRDVAADEILGALTGVTLAPDDLLAILTGCVVPSPAPARGRVHGNGWASIDLDGGATVYLQRAGGMWQVRAASRGDLQVEYPEWPASSMFPARVTLRAMRPVDVDLRASVSQVGTNTALPARTFTIEIPPDTQTISLDELRANGPLRGK